MSEHPGDNAINRFRAFWAGVLAFVSFGVVLWIALGVAGPRKAVEPGWAERGETRQKNLEEVTQAQSAVISEEAIQKSMGSVIETLKAKKAGKTELLVPGSPTFLKQAQQKPAEESKTAPAEAPAEPKAEAPAKPKTDAPPKPKADAPAKPKTEAKEAPKAEAKPKADSKPKAEAPAKPKADAKAKEAPKGQ